MTCAAEGGYLAVVDVVGEHLVLKEIFAKHPENTLFGIIRGGAHVGFRDLDGRGTWTTIHGLLIYIFYKYFVIKSV